MASSYKHARKLLKYLSLKREELSPLLILTHDFPDPDAIASACALQHLCREVFQITSKAVYGGIIGRIENRTMIRSLKLPIHRLKGVDLKKYKSVALVDTQPAFRNNSFPSNRRATIVIDQHKSDIKPNVDCFVYDADCGATSVIVAQALLLAKIKIPTDVSTALAYGIITDTQNFFRSHRKDIVKTYMSILPNCNFRTLAKIQNPRLSKYFFTTIARGINRAKILRGVIVSHLGHIEDPDSVSQVADLLVTFKNAQWSLCTGRYKETLRISLRGTEKNTQAADILKDIVEREGEAGGHDTIAGGNVTVGKQSSEYAWRAAESRLVQKLCKRLNISKKLKSHNPFL